MSNNKELFGYDAQQLVVNSSTNNVLQQRGFTIDEVRQAVTYLGRETLESLTPFFKQGPVDAVYIKAFQEHARLCQERIEFGLDESGDASPLADLPLSEKEREWAFDVNEITEKLGGVIAAVTVNIALSEHTFITDFLTKYYYGNLPTFSDLCEAQKDDDGCIVDYDGSVEDYDDYIQELLNSLADEAMENRSPDPLKVLKLVLSEHELDGYHHRLWPAIFWRYSHALDAVQARPR